MSIALLVLRVVVGLLFAGHGAQKLFGAFGGHGLAGTAGFFEALGMRPGRRNAVAAGAAELGGGLLLALGLITPVAAVLIISVMVVAIATVHGPKGPWITEGGYEYNAVLIAVAFAVAGTGPGKISLDHALGIGMHGALWAVGALAVGLLGGLTAVLAGRIEQRRPQRAPAAAAPAEEEPRFSREDSRQMPSHGTGRSGG